MREMLNYLTAWDAGDIGDLLGRFGIFVAGAVFLHLWNKFRSRTKRIRWASGYQRLAVAGEDAVFGRVEVLYNDNPVRNLYVGFIQVENESIKDFQDVELNFASSEGGQILVSTGALEDSIRQLPFADPYDELLTKAQDNADQLTPEEGSYLATRRDYQIPVFNRGNVANFTLLLHRDDDREPSVELTCEHLGVELVEKPAADMLWGVPKTRSLVVGLVLTFAAVAVLVLGGTSNWLLALGAWVLGLVVLIPGALAVKGWRRLVQLLS